MGCVLIIARLLEIVSPSLSFIENSIVPLLQSASDDPKTPPEVGPLVEVFARLLDARVLLVAQSEAEVHDCSLLPVIGTGPLLLSLLLCLWLSGHILVALLALVVIDILSVLSTVASLLLPQPPVPPLPLGLAQQCLSPLRAFVRAIPYLNPPITAAAFSHCLSLLFHLMARYGIANALSQFPLPSSCLTCAQTQSLSSRSCCPFMEP